jgi:hypothetical protein
MANPWMSFLGTIYRLPLAEGHTRPRAGAQALPWMARAEQNTEQAHQNKSSGDVQSSDDEDAEDAAWSAELVREEGQVGSDMSCPPG